MTIQGWLEKAVADANDHGLPDLKPLLEALARNTEALRQADEELHTEEAARRDRRDSE